ncbi:alpha/beta fold hydrolase [Alteromonas macleodii]|uniref:S9 family peptidase n=1 Tax=Alteromonas macleodii TaxID=28108 RepID=UPI0020768C64|nr:alpha/beta fold hydrolase [Alteromonas macleodii]USI28846.1 alpha/beta fold hydrolase [Alteromonas macleodii]
MQTSIFHTYIYQKKCYAVVLMLAVSLFGLMGCASSNKTEARAKSNTEKSDRALIPRSELFGYAAHSSLKLSPDGKKVVYKKEHNGVLNLWVGPTDEPLNAQPITSFIRAPKRFQWSADGQHILILEDRINKEMEQLWSVNVANKQLKNLTNDINVRTEIIKISAKHPNKVLVKMNLRDARFHDVFLIDIVSGERTEVLRNTSHYVNFYADADLRVRLAEHGNEDGSSTYFDVSHAQPTPVFTVPLDALRSTKVLSVSQDGEVTLLDSVNSEFANLVSFNVNTKERRVIVQAEEADITSLFYDKNSNELWATLEDPITPKWTVRSANAKQEFAALKKVFGESFKIAGQPDANRLLILDSKDGRPDSYYWWDRNNHSEQLLFSTHPNLEQYTLGTRKAVMIPTRDGLTLPSYLTLPSHIQLDQEGFPVDAIPLVVIIHGGPWIRSSMGFDNVSYWLADRGYAALSINYRGSVGFGKSFVAAADKQWAGDMHNDIIDSVDWAISNGITTKEKVASYGRSYGGYASLTSLAFTPDRFKCSVATAAPSNLHRLIMDMPPWWRYQYPQWINRVGNPNTEQGIKDLLSRSPISRVGDIEGRLLLTATGEDPRVLMRQSESMVGAMNALNKPVTYLLYEEQSHNYYPKEVIISLRAVTEHFLSDCLGMPAQAFGQDLEHSNLRVKQGAELVEGLSEALRQTGNKRFTEPQISDDIYRQ